MKNKIKDMTQGNPTLLLIAFSIPMLIGNIFQQLYNIVDSVIVGKLVGADALASIGATGSVTFLFFALCNGIASGGGIITSQFFGKKDDSQVKSCIANTGYIMIVFPAVMGTVAFLLARPLLTMLQTPENILKDALVYMRVMCVGLVFVSVYNFVSSMLRALGDSKTPLYFLIFSSILNTILDILFVGTLHLAVFGAAIATLISQLTSGFLCMIYAFKYNAYFKLKKEDLQINKPVIESTIRLGYRKSMILMLLFTAIMVPVMQLFGGQITSIFVNDAEVIEMGKVALRITSIFYPALGVIYVIRGVLNGVGDSFFALMNGIIEVIFRSLLPVALVMLPVFGVWGIWWAAGIVWFISGFTAWLRLGYYRKKVDF